MSFEPLDLAPDGSRRALVVREYSGGAHCCTIATLVLLDGGAPAIAQALDGDDSDVGFEDRDSDGVPEALLHDWTFNYWQTSHADSPAPQVVMAFDGARFVPSAAKMRAPPPDAVRLRAQAASLRQGLRERDLWENSALWERMLDLIYTGQAESAWRFLDDACPDERPGKADFAADFLDQLRTSPYYEVLRELNPFDPRLTVNGPGRERRASE